MDLAWVNGVVAPPTGGVRLTLCGGGGGGEETREGGGGRRIYTGGSCEYPVIERGGGVAENV